MAQSQIKTFFQIHFRDPTVGEIVTLKARRITDSSLGLSFISISDFLFDTQSLVVKPKEEQLQKRLENVKSLHISIYSIISIEEIGDAALKFNHDRSKLLTFPGNPENSGPDGGKNQQE